MICLRSLLARRVGHLASSLWGSDVPVLAQRLVRFLYCPWIGRGHAITRTVSIPKSGAKFEVDTGLYVDWQIWCYGTQDYAVESAIRSHLTGGGTFVDVGANSGYFSCLAAALGAQSHAFEPVSKMHAKLIRTHQLNPSLPITCHQVGCGDTPGTVTISLPEESDPNWGQSSILRPVSGETESIELTTIDEFFRSSSGPPIAMMKIDVEGAEHLVLGGAAEVIASQKPLIIFEANDESGDKCLEVLQDAGYSTKQLSRCTRDWLAIPDAESC